MVVYEGGHFYEKAFTGIFIVSRKMRYQFSQRKKRRFSRTKHKEKESQNDNHRRAKY